MRFYTNQHKYYCGIDLHAKNMYLCVLDESGETLQHKNLPSKPEAFLKAISEYKDDVVVGAECVYCWYWLADLCKAADITFVLGHALYMKAISGAKAKNDKLDSKKLAAMLKGGVFPMSYVYPQHMRATRDLMRRRLFFVNKRAELMTHVQMTHHQYNLAAPGKKIAYKTNRAGLELPFDDPSTVQMLESDLRMVEYYSEEIKKLERYIENQARKDSENTLTLALLQTIPGVGPILSLTLLYEIHTIERFPTVQQFSSYARLVKPEKTSSGKKAGGGGGRIGNPHLRWALSEVTYLMLRFSPQAKNYLERLQKKGSKPKAMHTLSHRIGKGMYFMLKRKEAFNPDKFFAH